MRYVFYFKNKWNCLSKEDSINLIVKDQAICDDSIIKKLESYFTDVPYIKINKKDFDIKCKDSEGDYTLTVFVPEFICKHELETELSETMYRYDYEYQELQTIQNKINELKMSLIEKEKLCRIAQGNVQKAINNIKDRI